MSFLHPTSSSEDEFPPQPCTHMRTLLSSMADGTLRGLLLRYAKGHIAGCAHCRDALSGLLVLRERLHTLVERIGTSKDLALTAERRATVEQEWDQLDKRIQ